MKAKLRDFLKEKGCHDEFVINFKKEYRGVIKSPNLSDFLDENKSNPEMWIRRSFAWAQTEQGAGFWSKINKEWRNALSGTVAGISNNNN